jgi:hAT family dimerisation domain.
MALDILSIPAMSSEPERVFSSVENNLSDRRNRTQMDLLENLELLKSWIKIKGMKLDK